MVGTEQKLISVKCKPAEQAFLSEADDREKERKREKHSETRRKFTKSICETREYDRNTNINGIRTKASGKHPFSRSHST